MDNTTDCFETNANNNNLLSVENNDVVANGAIDEVTETSP